MSIFFMIKFNIKLNLQYYLLIIFRLFQNNNFDVIYRYSTIVKTMYVGSFYASIVPMTLFIGLLSLLLSYWIDKVKFNL